MIASGSRDVQQSLFTGGLAPLAAYTRPAEAAQPLSGVVGISLNRAVWWDQCDWVSLAAVSDSLPETLTKTSRETA